MIKFKPRNKKPVIGATLMALVLVAFLIKGIITSGEGRGRGNISNAFARGTLTAAIEESPLTYMVTGQDTTGMHYDILRRFAEHHGLRLRLKTVKNMDEATEALRLGGCDIIATGIAHTMQARRAMHLSVPLHTSTAVVVHNTGTRSDITTPYDLAGKVVTLPKGSPYAVRVDNLQSEILDTVGIRTVNDRSTFELIGDVNSDKSILTVCDNRLAALSQRFYKETACFEIGFEQYVSFGTANGATALNDSLDTWLTAFKQTDDYRKLCDTYLISGRVK